MRTESLLSAASNVVDALIFVTHNKAALRKIKKKLRSAKSRITQNSFSDSPKSPTFQETHTGLPLVLPHISPTYSPHVMVDYGSATAHQGHIMEYFPSEKVKPAHLYNY